MSGTPRTYMEVGVMGAAASRAVNRVDMEFAKQLESELAAMTAERDEAVRKQAIDQAQCDWATSEAARLASVLAAAKAART